MSKGSGFTRVLLLLAALTGASCVSLEQAAPPVGLLGSPVGQQARLSLGRDIYVTKCTKCHSAEPVAKYSRLKWLEEILPEMAAETKLTAGEAEAVEAYVLAVLATTAVAAR